jgi:hypothetical protein
MKMKMKMKHAAQAAVVMLAAAALAAVLLACPPGEDEEGTGTGNPTGTGSAPQWQVTALNLSGPDSAVKGKYAGFYSVATFTGPETNAKKAVTWKIKDGLGTASMTTAGGSSLKANGRGALLTINANETAETITVVATSNYAGSTHISGERTVTIAATEPPNPDEDIMEMENMATGPGFTEVVKYQIRTNWEQFIPGANFFVDDKGKLALGEYDANLPYSSWYIMRNKNDHSKRGIKNIGTGNYINIKGIERFVGSHGSNILLEAYAPQEKEALLASQPNVSPFEDNDAFYWVFRPINQGAGRNIDEETGAYTTTVTAVQEGSTKDSIIATNILNYPFAKDTVSLIAGGALSHEWAGRTPLPSNNSPWLYHMEWRYDEGTMEDTVDNIPWKYRMGDWATPENAPTQYYTGSWDPPPKDTPYYDLKGWGGYNICFYDNWW